MQFNTWGTRLALGSFLFFAALACRTTDTFIAQATPLATRTTRPTFTPPPTATPLPPPTPVPIPTTTRTPTRRPPTPRPPTPKPAPTQVAAPQPTKPPYQYRAASFTCEHSGGSWLNGHVYSVKGDASSAQPGVGVVFGGAGGDIYDGPNLSDGNGDFAFVLAPDGYPARVGTYYVWLVDGSKNRISEMAGPIKITGGPDPGCWASRSFFEPFQ